jgi:hypothetical protein
VRQVHFVVGLLGVIAFLWTGVYMRSGFPELYEPNEALRYMYRANHVYVLLASLVNVVLGIYLAAPAPGWRTWVGRIGSGLAISSPALLLYAFLAEAPKATPDRVLTILGVFLVLFGVLAQLPSYRSHASEPSNSRAAGAS